MDSTKAQRPGVATVRLAVACLWMAALFAHGGLSGSKALAAEEAPLERLNFEASRKGDQLRRYDEYRKVHPGRGRGACRKGDAGCRPYRRFERRRVLTVDGVGRNGNYRTISAALKDVRTNGLIEVRPKSRSIDDGFYIESLVITRPVTIVKVATARPDRTENRAAIRPPAGLPCAIIDTPGEVNLVGLDWIIPSNDYPGSTPCLRIDDGEVTIDDNFVTGRSGAPAIEVRSETVVIKDNEIALAGEGISIEVDQIRRRRRADSRRSFSVLSNTIYQVGTGLSIISDETPDLPGARVDVTISGNQILRTSGPAMDLRHLFRADVSLNTLTGLGTDGIVLLHSGGRVEGNTITRCGRDGIVLDATPFGLTVSDNKVSACSGAAVHLKRYARGQIVNNRFRGNGACIVPRSARRGLDIDLRENCND